MTSSGKDGIFGMARRFVSNNTPAILTGLGVAGTVSTVILAVKSTPAAWRDISDAQSEQTEPLTKLEKVKLVWKHYIPSTVVGVVTITSIIGAQSINHRRQAALMGMYALTETSFREYREKAKEIIGESKEGKIRDEIAKEHLENVPMVNSEVIITGHGEHLCFDSMSSRYFRSDINKIRAAVNDINEQCLNQMNASMNEFYDKIGLPHAKFGEDVGWRHDHLMEVHFSSHINPDDGTPALSIEYDTTPIMGYYKING